MMQCIGRLYVDGFNALCRQTGTLWDGRFNSALVDSERYVLACYRCIELNPYAPAWQRLPSTTVGQAMATTHVAYATHGSPRIPPISRLVPPTRNGSRLANISSTKACLTATQSRCAWQPTNITEIVPDTNGSIVAREGMHQPRQGTDLARRYQQMHMVAHQHIRMQATTKSQKRLPQTLEVALAILVIQKTAQAIVASLHNMLRNTGKFKAWESGHARHNHSPCPPGRSAYTAHFPHPNSQRPVSNCP